MHSDDFSDESKVADRSDVSYRRQELVKVLSLKWRIYS